MDEYELTELEIDEVSLVGAPANRRPYVLFKNEQGGIGMPETSAAPPVDQVEVIKSAFGSLTDEQRAVVVDRQFADSNDLDLSVKRSLLLALMSPRFLYRELTGTTLDSYDVRYCLARHDQPLLV